MNNPYLSEEMKLILEDFSKCFKSLSTYKNYIGDINEFIMYVKKDFFEITRFDVDDYYNHFMDRVNRNEIKISTFRKKLKELKSLSDFLIRNEEEYHIPESFMNLFTSYAIIYVDENEIKKLVPVNDIDKILVLAKTHSEQMYIIYILAYRIGLTSTQMTETKVSDVVQDQNGVYLILKNKADFCYVPWDVAKILDKFIEKIPSEQKYLFVTKQGKKLNRTFIHRQIKQLQEKNPELDFTLRDLRNTLGCTMNAYDAQPKHIAENLRISLKHIKKYRNAEYKNNLKKEAGELVQIQVLPPE